MGTLVLQITAYFFRVVVPLFPYIGIVKAICLLL